MRFSVVIISLLCIYSCTKELAGPTTEQGNPQITAVIVDSLGNPIANVPISLLVIYQTEDSLFNEQLLPANAIKISSSRSAPDGSCDFSNLAPGKYRIVANDSARNRSVTSNDISLYTNKDTTFMDTLILQQPGIVKGVVIRSRATSNQQLRNGFIQIRIRELEQFYITDPNGTYTFYNLPYGTYTLYYYAPDGFHTSRMDNITVYPGKTTIIDTVILTPYQQLLPPADFKGSLDTTNSLVMLSWLPVTYQTFRYYEIERICNELDSLSRTFKTSGTSLTDTLRSVPEGTLFSYVIHSVDSAYNKSVNAGPLEIVVVKN
ncbi:MAG TPA: carboxypeptidase-like regulatory domain-containing protein [Chitinispirillaceae bacterium]|nr:carboxypeptidase-like regulatory domain-containing protein [Chitinispirillaceae bacterium]